MQKDDLTIVLKEMGFKMQEIVNMSDELKKAIIANGGKKVETTSKKASYTFYNDGIEYTVEGKDIAETKVKAENLKEEILNEKEENTFSILTAGWQDTNDGIDASEDIWSVETFVVYLGISGGVEHRYKIYFYFDWVDVPYFQTNDNFGVGWDQKATEIANQDYASVLRGPVTYAYPIQTDNTSTSGTQWRFLRDDDVYDRTAYGEYGYGYETIGIPTAQNGTSFIFYGAYAHPYSSWDISINFGPLGIGYSGGLGDKWDWEEGFIIGQ